MRHHAFSRSQFPAVASLAVFSTLPTMNLVSLASKQIWPHVLAAQHLKPRSITLLHSLDAAESRMPAQRLKRFFDKLQIVGKTQVRLESLPDSEFSEIEKRFDELAAVHSWNLGETVLNVTGGNKLMALAAFRWALRRSVKTFYLERRNRISWFEFRDGETFTSSETMDGHIADALDPVDLIRCQVEASEVEREGESLSLNEKGEAIQAEVLFQRIANGADASEFLRVRGKADSERKEGDRLELAAAAVLLKLGVMKVQRSLRLKVKQGVESATRLPHAEIDLLFSWGGKLWLVDCKDRKDPARLLDGLTRELRGCTLSGEAPRLMKRISKELSISQTKVMKEDILAIREIGGLLGQVVCIRKSPLPDEVQQYAVHNRIEIIRKSELVQRWQILLHPERKASAADLADLAGTFKR
jgi:hypothetical protein